MHYYFIIVIPHVNEMDMTSLIESFSSHMLDHLSLYDQPIEFHHIKIKTKIKLTFRPARTAAVKISNYLTIVHSFKTKNTPFSNNETLLGFSEISSSQNELPKLYIQASTSLLLRDKYLDDTVFVYNDVSYNEHIDYDHLLQLIHTKNQTETNDMLVDIFFHIVSSNSNLNLIKFEFSKLIDYIANNFNCMDIKATLLSKTNKDLFIKRILNQNSIYIIYNLMKALINKIIDSLITSNKPSSLLVEQTLAYIFNNYNEDISLNKISETLYVSPSYLSKIFSSQIGTTFSKYLTLYRINKAKDYLIHTQYKIYEIAEKVGYSDIGHFSKIFKNSVGTSPKKYKKIYNL